MAAPANLTNDPAAVSADPPQLPADDDVDQDEEGKDADPTGQVLRQLAGRVGNGWTKWLT